MSQTHRHGPEGPPLRHLRAAAAIEREDRAASPSALHVVFPTTEVTKGSAARKSGPRFLTKHAPAIGCAEARVHSLPQRRSSRLTCYRDTAKFRLTCYRCAFGFPSHVVCAHGGARRSVGMGGRCDDRVRRGDAMRKEQDRRWRRGSLVREAGDRQRWRRERARRDHEEK